MEKENLILEVKPEISTKEIENELIVEIRACLKERDNQQYKMAKQHFFAISL